MEALDGLTSERCATLWVQSRKVIHGNGLGSTWLVELVINRLVALSASDIGREDGNIDFSKKKFEDFAEMNRTKCSLNVV